MQGPLEGILVVDLTRYLPGAFASRELLRLGARVVRVEQPSGAAGVAALMHGRVPRGRVAVVLSGGNVGAARFAELVTQA